MSTETNTHGVENVPQALNWIFSLKRPTLVQMLEGVGLETTGITSTLRVRLFNHIRATYRPPTSDEDEETRTVIEAGPSQTAPIAGPSNIAIENVAPIPSPRRLRPDTLDPWHGAQRQDMDDSLSLPELRERSLPRDRSLTCPTHREQERAIDSFVDPIRRVTVHSEPYRHPEGEVISPTVPSPMASARYLPLNSNLRTSAQPFVPGGTWPTDQFQTQPDYTSVPPPTQYRSNNAPYQSRGPNPSQQFNNAYNILRRLDISFSGKSGEDAEAFLQRVSEAREIVNIPDIDLFQYLPFFLSGIAMYWFRSHRREWPNWSTFVESFRARFGARSYQVALRVEISRRIQAENEPVADYLTCIRTLMERVVPPMSEFEWITWAHTNMLPWVQALIDINAVDNFSALEARAIQIETSYLKRLEPRVSLTPERSLFPALAFQGPTRNPRIARKAFAVMDEVDETCDVIRTAPQPQSRTPRRSPNTAIRQPTPTTANTNLETVDSISATNMLTNPFLSNDSAPPPVSSSNPASAALLKCWNCGELGHRYIQCTKPRAKIFCHRCGRADVTRLRCPTCSGNGRETR